MSSIYEVFGVSSDLQLSNIFNKLDLSVNELFDIDSIINNSRTSMKKKREQILEVMSSSAIGNYEICMDAFEKAKLKTKRFIKEEQRFPKQSLNMNQIMELNNLFSLASEKFKKVNCSQQFYQMLSQKTSKNVANVFFNMLKSIPEDSNCRFDPEMIVNGQNFAQTIYPFVNELTTFLNGCKSESKKEEVNEDYDADKLHKIDIQIAQLENNLKNLEQEEKNSYLNQYEKMCYDLDKIRLRKLKAKREEYLNESIETQPDMFGGPDTYYKDGIEALDFDNVLDAMNKVAPEMDFVDDRDVRGKYSMIFQPKSSGLELNQKGLKKIKDYLSQKFGKENIAVRLAHSQYAPEIKKLYITFINQIDVQNELENEQLNESLDDTLNNFKYFITSSNNEKELNFMKDKLNILFNQSNDVKLQNTISELLSMIKSKLNKIRPTIDECCELSNLLEPFKPTVINITVNDDGCLEDIEKETATNNLKALASHINDKKDCCEENNIENMQTIMSLISSLTSFFQKRLCESKKLKEDFINDLYNPRQRKKPENWESTSKANRDFQKWSYHNAKGMPKYSNDDVREELNDIKQDYLNNELDVYDATNEVDNLIGNKSEAEAIVNSWDDPSKHGLYGITDDEELDEMCSGGACCAGSVATVPSPAKPKSPKRKHKKSKVDEMALNMFKRQIIEDANGQINLNGNHYEYKDGYFYINGDIARTKSKYKILEYLDENIELETLTGFNSEEMKLLEDIEASGNVGNEDDNNQNNNSNNNNNADNNNTQQNINQDNLGNVDQNVTQDNDLTPQQRQLKKDTEKTLDQSMKSGSNTEVSVNQGLDNNNDTINNPTPNTNNIKYKVIGKDDSDTNNIKYIIQDPNTKQTMVVDATKLRLEK